MKTLLYIALIPLLLVSAVVAIVVIFLLWIWTTLVVTAYWIRRKLTGRPSPPLNWPPDDPTNS